MSESIENISFFLKDDKTQVKNGNDTEILSLLKDFNDLDISTHNDNDNDYNNNNDNDYNSNGNELNQYYSETYTVPKLLKICEYYGFLKYVKMAKYKKPDIIDAILVFEMDENNTAIVTKRQQLWETMETLANDKFMKKYIIWN